MNFLYPSPNEEKYLKEKETKSKRLLRLQQVRNQEKELASKRRSNYKQVAGKEWNNVLLKLKKQFIDLKHQELDALLDLELKSKQKIGIAMKNAAQQENIKHDYVIKFTNDIINSQKIEDQRLADSLQRVAKETELRLLPIIQKQNIMDSITKRERERASRIAALRKSRLSDVWHVNIEIPNCPIGKHDRNQKLGYDETCFHREYAVVKCKNDQETKHDAWDAAAIAEKNHNDQLQKKSIKLEKMNFNLKKRNQQSEMGLTMDIQKITLEKELQDLVIDDRKRRQENAGHHAAFYRRLYVDMGEKELKKRFENQFKIDDDGILEKEDESYKNLPRGKFEPHSISTENSIEFIKTGEIEVYPARTYDL